MQVSDSNQNQGNMCVQDVVNNRSIKHLPQVGYNSGIVIPLKCACPPACMNCLQKGQSAVAKNWYHKTCGKQSYINQYGDIFCDNHFKDPKNCDGYFIKGAKFNCSSSWDRYDQNWNSFTSAAEFFMAIAQGMQAAEFGLQEQDILEFAQSLKEIVIQRWNQ